MGSTRRRPSDSCRSTVGGFACTPSRTPRSSIGTTLTTYPSVVKSRQARTTPSSLDVRPQRLAQDRFVQLGTEAGQVFQAGSGLRPRLGVALLHPRHDDLLDEAGLPVGGVAVEAQMAGLDAEAKELPRHPSGHHGVLVVER